MVVSTQSSPPPMPPHALLVHPNKGVARGVEETEAGGPVPALSSLELVVVCFTSPPPSNGH